MLTVQHVSFERQLNPLFKDIHFAMNHSECIQLRGTNGSGKSTLLRIIAGFIEPSAGDILWKQQSIFNELQEYQQHIHYIGHHAGVKHRLTVYENIKLYAALHHSVSDIQSILQTMQLTPLMHAQTETLSAGQLRRLSLARLLVKPAPLWILDEPTTSLDKEGETLLTQLIEQHIANHGMVIMATHHPLSLGNFSREIQLGDQNA